MIGCTNDSALVDTSRKSTAASPTDTVSCLCESLHRFRFIPAPVVEAADAVRFGTPVIFVVTADGAAFGPPVPVVVAADGVELSLLDLHISTRNSF